MCNRDVRPMWGLDPQNSPSAWASAMTVCMWIMKRQIARMFRSQPLSLDPHQLFGFSRKWRLYTCSRFQARCLTGSICKRPYLLSTYRMNSISERTRFCYNAAWLCNKARSNCCHGFATNAIIPISIPLQAGPHISLKNERFLGGTTDSQRLN